MKSTGIVRNIDDLGRVVIPKEVRKVLDLKNKDPIEIFTDGSFVLLQKYEPFCIFCHNSDDIEPFEGKNVCGSCISKMKSRHPERKAI